ncbi:unnamed protein product [Nippostrongylus brasiliensis]|uniref:mitogen-activated protein kinase kinase kinase n=1 Tax=Nippostrongylus brasiliensis TaxID=27835 RepID=A0A158R1F9_NIPBR|nr:unnamed protein product [Nippostrongylus brasiliensis]
MIDAKTNKREVETLYVNVLQEARAWPSVGERPGLRKLGSVSCEVLAWSDEEEMHNVQDDGEIHPYVNMPQKPFHPSASPSTDSEADFCKPAARKSTEEFPSTEQESEADTTDFEVTFRDSDGGRDAEPSQVYEILYDYKAKNADELDLVTGATVKLIRKTDEESWYLGECEDGRRGLFPVNYVRLLGSDARLISADEILDPPTGKKSIGRGASAEVFRVLYQGEFVALKKVRDTSDLEALKREAVVINRLRHRNIIHLLGVCQEPPRIGLVLELCDGGSLKELCQKLVNSFVSVRILVDWAAQIASGMGRLASANLMHRDLKADNVLVKESVCLCNLAVSTPTSPSKTLHLHNEIQADGFCRSCRGKALDRLTMKITDFGNTKKIKDEEEKRQSLVGTYAWMAPEAYRFHNYSEASDVWSFGVVLWELLTRKDPHQGHLPITVAYLVSTSNFDLPIADNCPLKWKSIMQSCWNVDAEKRPTFAKLLELFNEYREELEREPYSEEQEALVQSVRNDLKSDLTEVYVQLNESGHDKMRALCHKLYQQLDLRGDSSSKLGESPAPEVRERRKGKKKIEKQDISQPQVDRKSSNGLPMSTNVFGTLPRREKERLDVHRPLQPNLSISYPNLNELDGNVSKKSGTLQRKDAIRKKRPALHDENDWAAHPVYDPDAENRPQHPSPGKVGGSGRRSEGAHEDSNRMKKRYVKPQMHQQPGTNGLGVGVSYDPAGRSPRREIGIDEIIPTTPEGNYGAPLIPVKHHHRRTPSDEKGVSRQNAFHNGHNPIRSPHHYPSQPNLSTVIPPSTSSYNEPYTTLNTRIPPPSTDPYITCPAPRIGVVNNVPYLTMIPKNSVSHGVVSPPAAPSTVQNDQYIHCPRKPERPITLNLTHAHTPESSGISTGGSSAFSNLSLADAVPMTHAPPPPRPPIIPPRDGSIGL